MKIFLETARLILREFTPADVSHLVELDSDPAVMRYLTNGAPTPESVVRDSVLPSIIEGYALHPRHGRWATIERSSGEFLGWHSLDYPGDGREDEAELGYRLRRAAWGKGFATEGSRALIHKAFTELGIRRVYAETMAVNTASRAVMERSGLAYVRTFQLDFDDPIPGTELGEVEYAITLNAWKVSGVGGIFEG